MPIRLEDYQEVAGPGVIEELRALAGRVVRYCYGGGRYIPVRYAGRAYTATMPSRPCA